MARKMAHDSIIIWLAIVTSGGPSMIPCASTAFFQREITSRHDHRIRRDGKMPSALAGIAGAPKIRARLLPAQAVKHYRFDEAHHLISMLQNRASAVSEVKPLRV